MLIKIGKVFNSLNDYGVGITGIATVLLAIITAGLVLVARKQIKTTRAQLRAYVLIDKVEFLYPPNKPDSPWSVRIILRNSGQTPAYFSVVKSQIEVRAPIADDAILDPSTTALVSPTHIIPPGREHFVHVPNIITGRDEFISHGPAWNNDRAYVWGQIDYVDAFGKKKVHKISNGQLL